MLESAVAERVWAQTKDLSVAAGTAVQQLQSLRRAVADAVVATGGGGFVTEALPPSTDPRASDAEACRTAAREAIAAATGLLPTLIGVGRNGEPQLGELALRSGWQAGATDIDAFGPFVRAGDVPENLYYLFRARTRVAGDLRPGFLAEYPVVPPELVAPVITPRQRLYAALAFFGALVVLFAASHLAATAGDIAGAAAIQFRYELAAAHSDGTDPCQFVPGAPGTPAAWVPSRAEVITALDARTDCSALWTKAVASIMNDTGNAEAMAAFHGSDWLAAYGRIAFVWISQKTLSLQAPLVLMICGMLILMVAGGLITRGQLIGAFVDDRNRISLTRAQLIAWTAVLLAGIWVFGIANVGLGSGAFEVATGEAAAEGAQIFPSIPAELLMLLGISVASPAASRLILNRPRAPSIEAVSDRDNRPEDRVGYGTARWSDLIVGETVGKAHSVDIARVQYLAVTGILIAAYLTLMWHLARLVDGVEVLRAVWGGTQLFPIMPQVDDTFLQLLLFSHAGLIIAKVADSKTGENPGPSVVP